MQSNNSFLRDFFLFDNHIIVKMINEKDFERFQANNDDKKIYASFHILLDKLFTHYTCDHTKFGYISSETQIRSNDEPSSRLYYCQGCGKSRPAPSI